MTSITDRSPVPRWTLLRIFSVMLCSMVLGVLLLSAGSGSVAHGDAPHPDPAAQPIDLRDGYVVSGDMIIPTSNSRLNFRANLWPNGVVPYIFDRAVSQLNRERTVAAMREWETAAGVRFVPRTGEGNYLKVIGGKGNYAYVGMIGGEQTLQMENWESHYTIVHELGHTLGMWHEQQRPDRDTYVRIRYENVAPVYHSAFDIIQGAVPVGGYDFESVMHYYSTAFSINGGVTIEARPPYAHFQDIMGMYKSLSSGDRKGMNSYYPGTPKSWGDTRDYPINIQYLMFQPYAMRVDTTRATVSGDDPAPSCLSGKPMKQTTWFSFDTGYDANYYLGPIRLKANAQGYDTTLALYIDTLSGPKEVACIDQAGESGIEALKTPIKFGQRYYMMVASSTGGKLNFDAKIEFDDFIQTLSQADDISNAIPITSETFVGTMDVTTATLAPDDPVASCISYPEDMRATVWFSVTPLQAMRMQFTGEGYMATASVWTGERGSLTEVACTDDAGQATAFDLSAGKTHYIMVAGDYYTGTLTFTSKLTVHNYLTNGDLEDGNADKMPDHWTLTNPVKSKSKCDKPKKTFSISGSCAFLFKGVPNSKVRLEQVAYVTGQEGDQLRFSAWASNKKVAYKHKVKIILNFVKNGVATKSKVLLRPQDLPHVYRQYQLDNLIAPSDYDQIHVRIQFGGPTGKLFLDDVSLSLSPAFGAPHQSYQPLPLP